MTLTEIRTCRSAQIIWDGHMGVLCTTGSVLQGWISYAATKEITKKPKICKTCTIGAHYACP